MRRLLAAPLIAIALAAAGCGGDDEPGSAAAPTATTEGAPAETPAPAADGEAVEVGMKGLQFEPRDVTVKVGTTVTWVNNEEIPHNVVAEEGADFESDTFGKDGTYEYVADAPGVVKYVCTLHPGMEGTLSVEE